MKKVALIFILSSQLACGDIQTQEVDAEIECSDTMTIVFSGDLMQHMPQIYAAKTDSGYNYDHCFESIKKLWQSVDFSIVNLETTLSDNGNYSGYPMFSSPAHIVESLRSSEIDVVALANNHSCDKLSNGIYKTLQSLEKSNIRYIGVSRKSSEQNYAIIEKNKLKVAILNYTYGTNGMPIPKDYIVNIIDTLSIKASLSKVSQDSVNKVVIFFHWGDEYYTKQNLNQEYIANWCLNNGIDYVIGSHPHVVQPIDTSKRVVYSLGNLVSNQSKRYQNGGISVKLTVTKNGMKCEYIPHWVDRNDKYKILLPIDTLRNNCDAFMQSLNDSRDLVGDVQEIVL